jgi:two-component system, NtrC family, sensor histidine kinase PilS
MQTQSILQHNTTQLTMLFSKKRPPLQVLHEPLQDHSNEIIDAGKIHRLELLSFLRTVLACLITISLGIGEHGNSNEPLLIAMVYAVSSMVAWRVLSTKPLFWLGVLFTQLMLDMILIGLLVLQLGGDSHYVILYIMPIATGATLLKRPLALFVGAISVITLLLDGLRRQWLLQQRVDWLMLGLYGVGGFVCIVVLRLAAEHAERNEILVRQAHTSALLIQELQEQHLPEDSIAWIVFDQSGVVHVLNNMARSLAWQAGVLLEVGYRIKAHSPLLTWLSASREQEEQAIDWPPQLDQAINTHHPHPTQLRTATSTQNLVDDSPISSQRLYLKSSSLPQLAHMTALTLELASARNSKQQQAQLVAMGQISASIAHEIRNPLGAISQAAELIKEGGQLGESDTSLINMVLTNTQRIERIVRNLLTWSRCMQAHPSFFSPHTHVASLVQQLVADMAITPKQVVFQGLDFSVEQLAQYASYKVLFDVDHLYQVLSNLLSNALRYATSEPGSVMVALRPRGNHLSICVIDNGHSVDAGVVAHLFEPFQSTSKQGTGLGLYLCREYAVANQSVLQLVTGHKLKQLFLWNAVMDISQWTTVVVEPADNGTPSMSPMNQAVDHWYDMRYTKAFVLSVPWQANA